MIEIICVDITGLTEGDYRVLYEKASRERKERADRYRHREDALRCVTADALLRYVLGTDDYTVEKTPAGKPFVPGKENFHYNLSHSGRWVVIAFGRREVGVDVETLRPDTDIENIARRFFAPDERNYVFEDQENQRIRFFEIWTGKESYLKYLGLGLMKDLASFSIFDREPGIRLHHRTLDAEHCLSVCSTCDDYLVELLDVQRLV